MTRITAQEAIDLLLDPGSWQSWDEPPVEPADDDYRAQLERAHLRAGTDESVLTGQGVIAGMHVALVVGEFDFLAGSVGSAAAQRIVRGVRQATRSGLPLLGLPTSGGTRMQEGTPAFLQMVPIAAAVAAHRKAGLPYLVWLRDPTLGGVMATWGSLGQVTAASAADATVGFLGARVFEAMHPEATFDAQSQHAGHLVDRGVIDAVVSPSEIRNWFTAMLSVLTRRDFAADNQPIPEPIGSPVPRELPDAWQCVCATRRPQRPGVQELLAAYASDVTMLHGTTTGERGDAVVLALARIGRTSCVVIGQDRSADAPLGPAALRTARRGYRLAQEWGLPVVTVVDTEGAEVSEAAEEGAMAGEIARNLADLAMLSVPVVSVLLGSGCGGGALAMLPGDVVVAAADTWVTPLPPEGASAILHRTTERAAQMARAQHITAVELSHHGVIDVLVAAPDGEDSQANERFLEQLAASIASALVVAKPSAHRVERFVGAVDLLTGESK